MSDFREECIEAGRDAMGRNDSWRWWAPRHLYRLFDLWEPMIRETIATEIEAKMCPLDSNGYFCYDPECLAYEDAAEIARKPC